MSTKPSRPKWTCIVALWGADVKEAPSRILLDRAGLSGRLRRLIDEAGSPRAFCKKQEGGLSEGYLSEAIGGSTPPGPKILRAARVRIRVFYEVIDDDRGPHPGNRHANPT